MMVKLVALTALFLTTAASAVTISSVNGAPDPGPAGGQSIVVSFDAPNAAGYTFTGAISTSPVSISGAAAPAFDATTFGYVSSAVPDGTALLSTPTLRSISFYWGSIDTYNFVDVYGAGGSLLTTIVGGAIPPANGDQSAASTNRRVNIIAGPGEVITALGFRSTGVAFEFDDFAATAVPEPSMWALLIGGFGLVGVAARRRRMQTVLA